MTDKEVNPNDIEYNRKVGEATNRQESEQPKEQPKKELLRKRIQQRVQKYVKEKQEKQYEKTVGQKYNYNFLVQDPSGKWSLYQTVNAINKEQINNVRKTLQRERRIFTEMTGDPKQNLLELNSYTNRLVKTWKKNLVETGKEIKKEIPGFVEDVGQTFASSNKSQMPSMGIAAWGSMQQTQGSKSLYPSFQNYQPEVTIRPRAPTKPKKPRKQYVNNDEYESLLQQGLTEDVLKENGVTNMRSPFWVEQSKFGRSVSPYKPLSAAQLFAGTQPRYFQSEFQKRIAENRQYENFFPEFVGTPDESGRSTLIFTPPMFRSPISPRPLFKPIFAGRPAFSPMHTAYEVDQFGKSIAKKKFLGVH